MASGAGGMSVAVGSGGVDGMADLVAVGSDGVVGISGNGVKFGGGTGGVADLVRTVAVASGCVALIGTVGWTATAVGGSVVSGGAAGVGVVGNWRIASSVRVRGISRKKVLPLRYSLMTNRRPDIASVKRRLRYRPRPVPPISRVSELSTR